MGRKLCGTIPEQSRTCDNSGRLSHLTRAERTHEILYSCDSREELASRIAELEEFAQDLFEFAELYDEEKGPSEWCEITERAEKLGIEVDRWR